MPPADNERQLGDKVLRHFLRRSLDEDSAPAIRAHYALAYAGLCQSAAVDRLCAAIEHLALAPSTGSPPPDPPEARELLSTYPRRKKASA